MIQSLLFSAFGAAIVFVSASNYAFWLAVVYGAVALAALWAISSLAKAIPMKFKYFGKTLLENRELAYRGNHIRKF